MDRKIPTIQDVAREAQVSTATVSRALSHPDRVSESTRARVGEAIKTTGYTLNQAARSLRKREARTILVAVPDIGNPFFSPILEAIERQAVSHGYDMLVANRHPGVDQDARLLEYLLSHRADGMLILDGALDPDRFRGIRGWGTNPPLVVACEDIPHSHLNTVKSDNEHATRLAVEHLLALGHRRIAHIAGPDGNILTVERERGYRAALDAACIVPQPGWVARGDFHMDSGALAAHQFTALEEQPTAVFCANDEQAIGLISEMRVLGRECPGDISVVGFDDIPLAARYAPPLTTIRQPMERLGHLAAQLLLNVLDGSEAREMPKEIVLKSQLVIRGSTAAPR